MHVPRGGDLARPGGGLTRPEGDLTRPEGDLTRLLCGAGEEGVDAGGLTKELFALLIERLFDAQYGMFVHSDETRSVTRGTRPST